MDGFVLDEGKEYLIYGAGGNGFNVSQLLEKRGYCVKGFIDKRAESLGSVHGKSVWNLEDLEELKAEANKIVVIIAIKNVFAHSDIASELAERGLSQCIYKPLPILKGYSDGALETISRAHDIFFIDGDIPAKQTTFPKVSQSCRMYYKDRLLIEQNNGEVLAWMPLELLFNYQESDAYEKLNMAAFFPLNDLYRLFLSTAEEETDHILDNFYCYASEWAARQQIIVDEELKKSWIESRKAAFDQMQENFDYDSDFFCRSAPQAKMKDLGRFYLTCSGRNRVVFLSAKGYGHVPIRLDLKDYEKWLHKSVFIEIQKYIEDNHITKFFAPIAHPYLKDMPAENVNYYQLVCFPVVRYLFRWIYDRARKKEQGYCIADKYTAHSLINGCNILCDVNDSGAFSRYLDRCGFHVYRESKDDELTIFLDKLFYQNIKRAAQHNGEQYTVLFTDNRMRVVSNNFDKYAELIIYIEANGGNGDGYEGYVFEKTLSSFFRIDGMTRINVYKKISHEKP